MLKTVKNYFGEVCDVVLEYSDADLSASEMLHIISTIAYWCEITAFIEGVNTIRLFGKASDVEHALEDIENDGFELVY